MGIEDIAQVLLKLENRCASVRLAHRVLKDLLDPADLQMALIQKFCAQPDDLKQLGLSPVH